jgi:hypothetical protein
MDALHEWHCSTQGKVNNMLTRDLMQLKHELDSPRLSALRSSLGLAVPRAALRALERGTASEALPHVVVAEDESD